MFDRRQPAPRHDLFDVLRLVEDFFDDRSPPFPMHGHQCLVIGVVRRDVRHGAGGSRSRVSGSFRRALDEHV